MDVPSLADTSICTLHTAHMAGRNQAPDLADWYNQYLPGRAPTTSTVDSHLDSTHSWRTAGVMNTCLQVSTANSGDFLVLEDDDLPH